MFAIVMKQTQDWKKWLRKYRICSMEEAAGITIIHICYEDTACLIVLFETGKIETAFAMGRLIERYHIDGCILVGTCASTDKEHMCIGRFGIVRLAWIQGKCYATDRICMDTLYRVANRCGYEILTQDIENYDKFIQDSYLAEKLRMLHMTTLLDRECGVIAKIASLANIPFVAIKGVTNYANVQAVTDHQNNETALLQKSFEVAIQAIPQIEVQMIKEK